MQKVIFSALCVFLCAGCAPDPSELLKFPENHKMISIRAKKRRPIYNAKYIEQAKQNVSLEEGIDDDEIDEEYLDPVTRHKKIYRSMLGKGIASKGHGIISHMGKHPKSLKEAHVSDAESAKLKRELHKIKSELETAREELATVKCPIAATPAKVEAMSNTKEVKLIDSFNINSLKKKSEDSIKSRILPNEAAPTTSKAKPAIQPKRGCITTKNGTSCPL